MKIWDGIRTEHDLLNTKWQFTISFEKWHAYGHGKRRIIWKGNKLKFIFVIRTHKTHNILFLACVVISNSIKSAGRKKPTIFPLFRWKLVQCFALLFSQKFSKWQKINNMQYKYILLTSIRILAAVNSRHPVPARSWWTVKYFSIYIDLIKFSTEGTQTDRFALLWLRYPSFRCFHTETDAAKNQLPFNRYQLCALFLFCGSIHQCGRNSAKKLTPFNGCLLIFHWLNPRTCVRAVCVSSSVRLFVDLVCFVRGSWLFFAHCSVSNFSFTRFFLLAVWLVGVH